MTFCTNLILERLDKLDLTTFKKLSNLKSYKPVKKRCFIKQLVRLSKQSYSQ